MTEPPVEPPPGEPTAEPYEEPTAEPYEEPFAEPSGGLSAPSDQAYRPYPSSGGDAGSPARPQYWGQYAAPAAMQAGTAGPPPARRRRVLTSTLGILALIVAFGVGIATGRATVPKTAAASPAAAANPVASVFPGASSGSAASQGPAPDGTQGPAPVGTRGTVTGGMLPAKDLVSALVPLPPGAQSQKVTGAGSDGSMTLDQFVQGLFSSGSSEGSVLQARGFEGAAARWMRTSSAQQDDFYLIAFDSPAGAQSFALAQGRAYEDDPSKTSDTRFTVPGLMDGVGYETSTLDSYGNANCEIFGVVGNVTIIVNTFTPAKLMRSEVLTLVGQQVVRLAAAENAG
jgi:hypothetical protein